MNEPWVPLASRLFDPDHELASDPACKRWAWADLCNMAQRKDRRIVVGKGVLELRRGELFAAVRYLAERWQWSRSRVHRFLQLLQSDDVRKLELVRTTNDGAIYRLVTFDEYAFGGDPGPTLHNSGGTQNGTDSGTGSGTGKDQGNTGVRGVPRDGWRDDARDAGRDARGTKQIGIYTSSSTARDSKSPSPGVQQQRLAEWLGEGMEDAVAEVAGENPELWCRTFIGAWVTESITGGPDARARARAGEERWRGAVRDAFAAMVLEEATYSQRFFRSMVMDRLRQPPDASAPIVPKSNPMIVGVLPRAT